MSDKDSIKYLFNNITKENLASLIVSPKFFPTTLQDAQQKLTAKGFDSIKNYAQQIADSNNYKILKQTNLYITFATTQNIYTLRYNMYGGLKQFVIEIGDVPYSFFANYTFTYEDKKTPEQN